MAYCAEIQPIESHTGEKPNRENKPETSPPCGHCVACPKCENVPPQGIRNKGGKCFCNPPKGTKCKSKIKLNGTIFQFFVPDKLLSLSSTSGSSASSLFGLIYRMGNMQKSFDFGRQIKLAV